MHCWQVHRELVPLELLVQYKTSTNIYNKKKEKKSPSNFTQTLVLFYFPFFYYCLNNIERLFERVFCFLLPLL